MKVLFSSTAGLGHVHPMVPLARALQERGHEVRWATGAAAAAELRRSGFEADDCGMAADPRMAAYRQTYPEADSLPAPERVFHMFAGLFGEIGVSAMTDDLLRVARAWEPALMIHEQAEFAGPVVGALLGVPHVTHSYGSLVLPAVVERAGLAAAPVWRAHGLEPAAHGGCYDHLYIDIYPPSMQADEIVQVPRRQLARPVAFGGSEAGHRLADFIDVDGRPLVYLTFGTRWTINASFRLALECGREFDVQVLVTIGAGGDAGSLGHQPANVRVERYVPQTLILGHCQFVVSHAGSGTVLAALARGIPQLSLPQGADQFRNAANCERVGAGLQILPEAVTREALTGAFERLLNEAQFRASAEAVAREIAAMPSPGQVAEVVEGLVL